MEELLQTYPKCRAFVDELKKISSVGREDEKSIGHTSADGFFDGQSPCRNSGIRVKGIGIV